MLAASAAAVTALTAAVEKWVSIGKDEAGKLDKRQATPASSHSSFHMPGYMWWIIGASLVVAALSFAWNMLTQIRREEAERKAVLAEAEQQRKVNEEQIKKLREVTALATLLDLNQQQIDEYHRIATDQADRSFRSSQRAMTMGLVVLVACFGAGLWVPSSEARIFLGAIAAVGAALSGFINRTYIAMYGQTLAQLNRYFDQPVLTSFYLTAERLSERPPEGADVEMRREIIRQVLAASARVNGQEPAPALAPGGRRRRKSAAVRPPAPAPAEPEV
ncbi:hypothetical protein [Streptomyces sp. NPDC049040]|uniref:TRADD-N-associated membrane domain-containing protein n=1 Tax=Streptomyces sp. NPDC049040 TaxID=3365593 RepID=UPI00371EBF39